TEAEDSLAAAVEEMAPGYADAMAEVIGNTPMLIIMLVLTVIVAFLAIRLAEVVMKKQAAKLK
ncbi:MAG: MptD family putative ECF transporter S component, partial [Eggerthellaceae bacterium]|nr:MptD family putative ECF transporter S component [Eggerthellaceae bacterium]